SGHAHADRVHVGADVLHRVVDGEQRGDRTTRGIDVEEDVLVGILGLQMEELGHDQVGHAVVDRGAEEDDPVLEQTAIDVEVALAAARLLEDGGDYVILGSHSFSWLGSPEISSSEAASPPGTGAAGSSVISSSVISSSVISSSVISSSTISPATISPATTSPATTSPSTTSPATTSPSVTVSASSPRSNSSGLPSESTGVALSMINFSALSRRISALTANSWGVPRIERRNP